jgi:putative multiple sugar transport system substrate-binding protein
MRVFTEKLKEVMEMKTAKRIFALILCCACAGLLLQGCAGTGSEVKRIGVLMPSRIESRWDQDSDSIMRQLQAKGYQVVMKNAEDSVETQISQIEAMINDGCAVLVIAAIDGTKLKDVLQTAADRGIKVISYDRLLLDTPNVDYYATFDNFEVGVMQGRYLEETLSLKEGKGPFNIEIFAGSPDDNNSRFFYDGAMSILTPYIESGKLVVRSGQIDTSVTSIQGWKWETAQERMAKLLEAYYKDGAELHAILSPNDGLAIGIINALKEVGYGDYKVFPLLTGQDCAKENVIAMLYGEQSMSVFKDTRTLADRTVRMIDDLLLGKAAEINDTETYHNGMKFVPTYMCKPVYADRDNYKRVLIDSGYYNESDLT